MVIRRLGLLLVVGACSRAAPRATCPTDATCNSLGFECGELRCNADGAFDTSGCIEPIANATVAVAPPRESNGGSFDPSISTDGNRVAFYSCASNLVPDDRNALCDVFVRDLSASSTERVSVSAEGGVPAISGDGRSVAFLSGASNLVAGDDNDTTDLFVRDLDTGVTARIDLRGESGGWRSSLSHDGRRVAFYAHASDLVANDTNGAPDVFVHDLSTGLTERVSVSDGDGESNGTSWFPSLSADGWIVAFPSDATNLVSGDTNGVGDVFVRNLVSQTTARVSRAWDDAQADGVSIGAAISADGLRVAFVSEAANLVPGDTNTTRDLFVHDLALGTTIRANVSTGGAQNDGGLWGIFSMSADGTAIVFKSDATALAPVGNARGPQIFVRSLDAGTTVLASVGPDGAVDDDPSALYSGVSISGDGRLAVFASNGTNLAPDENGFEDVFVRDVSANTTTRVSVPDPALGVIPPQPDGGVFSGGPYGPLALAGYRVAFASNATNLALNDANGLPDIFLWNPGGSAALVAPVPGEFPSRLYVRGLAMSADARTLVWVVAWRSGEESLPVDVFVQDLDTGVATRLDLSALGDPVTIDLPAVSSDGRVVALAVADDYPFLSDVPVHVFVLDRVSGSTTAVCQGIDGQPANGDCRAPSLSADGRTVAFLSDASNLVADDDNEAPDIFVRDPDGTLERVTSALGASAVDVYGRIQLSGDGRSIVFYSHVPDDPNGQTDVFVLDRETGETTRMSETLDGGRADGASYVPSISADGRLVAFWSYATNLVPDDDNGQPDVFIRDRWTETTWRASVSEDGAEGDSASGSPWLSPDGRRVAFWSYATNLVEGTAGLSVPRVLVAPVCAPDVDQPAGR